MEEFNIVLRPLITEQSTHFANAKGAYSFQVAKDANKTQIRNAIEKIYNVKGKLLISESISFKVGGN